MPELPPMRRPLSPPTTTPQAQLKEETAKKLVAAVPTLTAEQIAIMKEVRVCVCACVCVCPGCHFPAPFGTRCLCAALPLRVKAWSGGPA
jgi:hypothetical protein